MFFFVNMCFSFLQESRSGGESEGEGDLEDVVSPQQEDVSPQQEDAPPHPARRPMNAFLIFCKRHRAQVCIKR